MLMFLGLILFFVRATTLSLAPNVSEVDAVLEGLSSTHWGHDEGCRVAMVDLLLGVKNNTLWSTWVWDATVRPSGVFYGSRYHLGGYSQCLDAPSPARTKYCLADIRLSRRELMKRTRGPQPEDKADEYFDYKTRYGRHINELTYGVCVPDACGEQGVRRLLELMLRHSHLHTAAIINVDSCQVQGEQREYGNGYYAFMWLLTILLSIAVLASLCKKSPTSDSLFSTIVNAWCMERNWSELIKITDDDIPTLNGIRSFNSLFVAGVHFVYYSLSVAVHNYLDVEHFVTNWKVAPSLPHLDIIINSYFTLSGLLHMKALLRTKQVSLWRILGKRYFRFIGLFALSLWFIVAVLPVAGSGPLWSRLVRPEAQDCSQNWWLSLLMLNNLINCDNICYLVTWYIQCDFQLVVLSSILYWIWTKNKRIGVYIFLVVAGIGFLMPGIISYWKQLSPLLVNDTQTTFQVKSNEVFTSVYMKPYCRTSSYFIGMAMGYFMTTYKPAQYKNIISKELSLLTVFGSLSVMQKLLTFGGAYFGKGYTGLNTVVFISLSSTIWALVLCSLIAACEYGTVPVIGSMLRSRVLVVTSRLAYGVYLSHMMLIFNIINAMHTPITSDFIALVAGGGGVYLLTLLVSLILWLTVEAPLNNISTLIFKSKMISEEPMKVNSTVITEKQKNGLTQ